jgi:C-terminal processing protease CtpA/Prc
MKRLFRYIIAMSAILAGICACGHKQDPETTEEWPYGAKDSLNAINTFAYNTMSVYYLWKDEVSDGLSTWRRDEDPISKVKSIRYKGSDGKEIDKWTVLTEDIEAMKTSTQGISTTYGFDFKLYYVDSSQKAVCMVVTLVYPDSPAEKAGFKRSDVFLKIAGQTMTPDNYVHLVYDEFLYAPKSTLTDDAGKTYELTAVEMYENPVLVRKVFEFDGKKVGYLLFNRFTLNACYDLVEAGKFFTSEGIDDLILDMRYNGGGYVVTESVLASILAPIAEVKAGSVFETAVYNDILAEAWGDDKNCFAEEFTFKNSGREYTVSVAGANPGIKHLYAILTGDSASASESILVGLMPYLDVKIFGEQSHGKYCTGIMYSAKDWYNDYDEVLDDKQRKLGKEFADKWGIYVMISRYADKNGNTPCMPDGFVPDYPVWDNPVEPYQLGDPREAMLSAVLTRLGADTGRGGRAAAKAPARALGAEIPLEHDPTWGAHILLR